MEVDGVSHLTTSLLAPLSSRNFSGPYVIRHGCVNEPILFWIPSQSEKWRRSFSYDVVNMFLQPAPGHQSTGLQPIIIVSEDYEWFHKFWYRTHYPHTHITAMVGHTYHLTPALNLSCCFYKEIHNWDCTCRCSWARTHTAKLARTAAARCTSVTHLPILAALFLLTGWTCCLDQYSRIRMSLQVVCKTEALRPFWSHAVWRTSLPFTHQMHIVHGNLIKSFLEASLKILSLIVQDSCL